MKLRIQSINLLTSRRFNIRRLETTEKTEINKYGCIIWQKSEKNYENTEKNNELMTISQQ